MVTNNETKKDAFEVRTVDVETGETVIVVQRGIIGAMANQLKATRNQRKGASILRKLGHVLSECGDIQYNKENSDKNIS